MKKGEKHAESFKQTQKRREGVHWNEKGEVEDGDMGSVQNLANEERERERKR